MSTLSRSSSLLVIRHVAWEGPHRILEACPGVDVHNVAPLDGQALPSHEQVDGAIIMGGPMNVDETGRYPQLATEREWLVEAMQRDMPLLGICLGAQLLARALGAEVRPGKAPELGFAPIYVLDPADPVLGALAPSTTVLHWHGDVFDLPAGARPLASSMQTEHQAFRYGNAWGLLFHPEADAVLVESWLAMPEMAQEAEGVLGRLGAERLPDTARTVEKELIRRSNRGFCAFAEMLEGEE